MTDQVNRKSGHYQKFLNLKFKILTISIKLNKQKWKKVKKWYMNQCGGSDLANVEKKDIKFKSFGILEYEQHQETALEMLRDGTMQMMHLAKFQHHVAKPHNWPPRGLTPEEAKVEFNRLCALPDAVLEDRFGLVLHVCAPQIPMCPAFSRNANTQVHKQIRGQCIEIIVQ